MDNLERVGSGHAEAEPQMTRRVEGFRIQWGDTLRNPRLTEREQLMKFDRVVANPPFAMGKWG